MTASFGGVCHIPALTFLARLRLRSRFADGKLEATSNILLMESTSVFFVRLKAVAVALLILLCYCGLNSNAACAATSFIFLTFFSFFLGESLISESRELP